MQDCGLGIVVLLQWCHFIHCCADMFNFSCVCVAEWPNHQQGHWSVLGGRNVQRCQLWPPPGGPEMLRSEVDDTQLDQASQALKPEDLR